MMSWFQSSFDSAAPPGTRVYAIGDIHGQLERLRALRVRIVEDAEGAPEERRVVVHVGDYVDRGPDSRGVLDLLIDEPLAGFDCFFLKGNHEDFMLRFLEGEIEAGAGWFANGGDATLASYGIEGADRWPDFTQLLALQKAFAQAMPARHRRFLEALNLFHVEGDYAFVHAGVRPGIALESQDPEDLMWIRETFHASSADHGHVIVHGHSVSPRPESKANRIGIDTGAGYGQSLTAVVLVGRDRRFLQV